MKKDKETFDVLLVGSGNMAMEYLKILKDLKKKVLIVGKSKKNVNFLKNLYPQFSFRYGGVKDFFGGLFRLNKLNDLEKIILSIHQKFKDRFYLEIQRHNDEHENDFENFLLKILIR